MFCPLSIKNRTNRPQTKIAQQWQRHACFFFSLLSFELSDGAGCCFTSASDASVAPASRSTIAEHFSLLRSLWQPKGFMELNEELRLVEHNCVNFTFSHQRWLVHFRTDVANSFSYVGNYDHSFGEKICCVTIESPTKIENDVFFFFTPDAFHHLFLMMGREHDPAVIK